MRLGANLNVDATVRGLGVVSGAGTSLDITTDAVVVASREGLEVVQTVEGDGILRGIVAQSSSIAGDVPATYVVGGFGANEETVTAKDSISGEGWALEKDEIRNSIFGTRVIIHTDLDNIEQRTGVETALLVNCVEDGGLGGLLGSKRGAEVKLQSIGNQILELDLVPKNI